MPSDTAAGHHHRVPDGTSAWSIMAGLLLLAVIGVGILVVGRRIRTSRDAVGQWKVERDAVLQEALDQHERTATFLTHWVAMSDCQLARAWTTESDALDRIRGDLGAVVNAAPGSD